MKKFNYFITLEGPEGSGKSTLAKKLAEYFESKGQEVVLTREPGGKGMKFSEEIRNVIMNNDDIDPLTELLLFEASRSEHIDKLIKPSISDRKLVICDRFIDSSVVYQGVVKGVGIDKVKELNALTIGETVPSLTLLVDLPAEIGLKRISDNDRETNRFDQNGIDFHERIRKGYLDLADETDRIVVINGDQTPEEVFEDALKEILKIYND